ncbi:hypothetical protein NXV86_21045 [Bacteroides sp. BFG-257]|uniref:hypothetical protein n=1 Tax=Bacteroides sp. BFG-257 TaxID=2972761 RepID=UPI0021616126|nr:hypothetical protein [Bacteroides sp. BFG-257]UVO97362.1 hypothetical protein NXV86_21045 [Bacteroides sp. BFG-257]
MNWKPNIRRPSWMTVAVLRKSARWKYRIYGSFNYEYLFDAQGQLMKMNPIL